MEVKSGKLLAGGQTDLLLAGIHAGLSREKG